MKVFAFVLLAMIVALATAQPLEKKQPNACQKACASVYSPICGKPAEGKGTDITFGSPCVLENYNCEKPDRRYVKASEGACPGNAPERLS